MAKLFLKKNEEYRIKNGYLWIFSNEVDKIKDDAENGDTVDVYDSKNNFFGSGFYNKNSLITVRLFGKSYNGDFNLYLKEKLIRAFELRKLFYPHRESFRLVYSESDYLPGLIIDKYNNTYVMQVNSFGMQKNISSVVDILKEEFKAENIFTRNESYFRKLEGLPESDDVYHGCVGEETIDDGKIKYKVDFKTGQKTGFYFDQCDNREFIEKFVKDKKVLDAFCNSGGFGMHAAYSGALSVSFLDSSEKEIQNASNNFILNGLKTSSEFMTDDVFSFLEDCIEQDRKFDVVILDPPAFAKSKKSLPSAIKGYIKLNKLALKIVSKNGFLASSSCSHHLKRDDFINAINSSAAKANRKIQLLQFNTASLDHPQLPSMEETSYLKFAVFCVV